MGGGGRFGIYTLMWVGDAVWVRTCELPTVPSAPAWSSAVLLVGAMSSWMHSGFLDRNLGKSHLI